MIVENSRYYIFKNEILNSYIEFEREIDIDLLVNIFILINKHYPSFLIRKIDFSKINQVKKWEDVILENIIITSDQDISIDLYVPLYYPTGDDFSGCSFGIFEDSMHIYYGYDKAVSKNFFAINFYGNVFTNIAGYWKSGPDPKFVNIGREYIKYDITEVATKNRAIMKSFLIELESLLDGEVVEYLSHHLDQKDINKYGINDDAVFR
jgi:hypothetical protein